MLGFSEGNRGGRIVLMGFDLIWTDEGGVARAEGKKREQQIGDINEPVPFHPLYYAIWWEGKIVR
jgi:hypothetical protein